MAKKKRGSKTRKSAALRMKELPIVHLTAATRRDLLLELVECFRLGDIGVIFASRLAFDRYDVDVTVDDEVFASRLSILREAHIPEFWSNTKK
jgi:hypothetical protein